MILNTKNILAFAERWPLAPIGNVFAGHLIRRCERCQQIPIEAVLTKWEGKSLPNCWRCHHHRVAANTLLKKIIKLQRKERQSFASTPLYVRSLKAVIHGVFTFGLQKPQPTFPPIACVWNVTNLCDLKCHHCYQDSQHAKDIHKETSELSTAQALRAVDIIAKTGCASLSFSGGEPLIRSDFLEIAQRASQRELFCTLNTNGTQITDHTTAEELVNVGIKGVAISLDSFDATFHDEFRGVPGAHAAAKRALEICAEIGKFKGLIVATTLTNRNLNDIPELIELAMEIGATRFYVSRILPVGRGKALQYMDVTPAQRREVLKYLANVFVRYAQNGEGIPAMTRGMTYFAPQCAVLSKQNIFPISEIVVGFSKHHTEKLGAYASKFFHRFAEYASGCATGLTYFGLSPKGDILPCAPATHLHLGNIFSDGLENIWVNHPVFKTLRERHKIKGKCGICNYNSICGGCRVTAYGKTGDWLSSDSSCPYH